MNICGIENIIIFVISLQKKLKFKFLFTMRKLLALLFVASVFTFAACEKKTDTASTEDTTATAAPDPAAPDTMSMPADSMAVDSVAK